MDEPHIKKEITLTEAFKKIVKDKRREIGFSAIFWPAIALFTGMYLLAPIGIVSNGMRHAYNAHKYKIDVNAPNDNKKGFLKEHFGRALDLGAFMGGVGLFMSTTGPTVAGVVALVGLGMVSGYTFEYFGEGNKDTKNERPHAPQVP